ncbi:MAG: hypothetical protein K0Q79_74 [Flavipsychrobacter sp.]|nr:hypothetical protein [Flavipsychrobacter sp.]
MVDGPDMSLGSIGLPLPIELKSSTGSFSVGSFVLANCAILRVVSNKTQLKSTIYFINIKVIKRVHLQQYLNTENTWALRALRILCAFA